MDDTAILWLSVLALVAMLVVSCMLTGEVPM
jgi:hypothetical protein